MPREVPVLLVPIVSIVCGTGLVVELAKLFARGRTSSKSLEAYEKRLARVEVALDELTSEIGRVVEGQQFLTKVLAERGTASIGER